MAVSPNFHFLRKYFFFFLVIWVPRTQQTMCDLICLPVVRGEIDWLTDFGVPTSWYTTMSAEKEWESSERDYWRGSKKIPKFSQRKLNFPWIRPPHQERLKRNVINLFFFFFKLIDLFKVWSGFLLVLKEDYQSEWGYSCFNPLWCPLLIGLATRDVGEFPIK